MQELPPNRLDSSVAPLVLWKRLILILFGCLFVGCAYIGVLLPGVPTTPFLLLASFCFVRSSPKLHRWLLRSPVFGKLLRDWHSHRGIRKPVKIVAITTTVIVVSCSIALTTLPTVGKIGIGVLAGIGILTILALPTIHGEVKPLHTAEKPSNGINS
ncbi:MAG: YbaN family protein [Zavarzinella sp.]